MRCPYTWTRSSGCLRKQHAHTCPREAYLTQSVFEVVSQKSIPTKIRQCILFMSNSKGQVDAVAGELTCAKRFNKHSVWDKGHPRHRVTSHACRVPTARACRTFKMLSRLQCFLLQPVQHFQSPQVSTLASPKVIFRNAQSSGNLLHDWHANRAITTVTTDACGRPYTGGEHAASWPLEIQPQV